MVVAEDFGVYVLDEKRRPLRMTGVDGFLQWGEWFSGPDAMVHRRVALDTVGAASISTVFLGCDHGFGSGPHTPVLFETMVFWVGSDLDQWCDRYETWDEALDGHCRVLSLVRQKMRLVECG